jgi:AcrR family transcriptional regulator
VSTWFFTHVRCACDVRRVTTTSRTRERLLDAAWREATQRGVADLTLARVAARAGVSRQTVYLQFGNRSTLLVEMARRIDRTSGFLERLTAARRGAPRAAFRRVLEVWFDYIPTILPVARDLEASALTGGDGAEAYRDRMTDWREVIRLAVARVCGDLHTRWTTDTASDWTWAQVHPTNYHHLVAERGWTPGLTQRTLITSLQRELFAPRGTLRRALRVPRSWRARR